MKRRRGKMKVYAGEIVRFKKGQRLAGHTGRRYESERAEVIKKIERLMIKYNIFPWEIPSFKNELRRTLNEKGLLCGEGDKVKK